MIDRKAIFGIIISQPKCMKNCMRRTIIMTGTLAKAGLVVGPLCPSPTLLGCLVCVICSSKRFHSFLFKLCIVIKDVHLLFSAPLINIFSFLTVVELRHFFHQKYLGGA